jgi:hypothetical protein
MSPPRDARPWHVVVRTPTGVRNAGCEEGYETEAEADLALACLVAYGEVEEEGVYKVQRLLGTCCACGYQGLHCTCWREGK